MNKYYRLQDDVNFPNRWHLGELIDGNGNEIEQDLFIYPKGRKINLYKPLSLKIDERGSCLDFTFTSYDMPLVKKQIGSILESFEKNGIQRIPVNIESCEEEYEILNIFNTIDCLDEGRSEILFWKEEDGRPDKVGKYRMVTNMHVDPDRAVGFNIFRLGGWQIAIIVSERVKSALEKIGATGIRFTEV